METLEGVVISHAGTATSNRLRPGHANSFNLLEGDRRHLRITTMVWRKGAFHESELRQFKLEPRDMQRVIAQAVAEKAPRLALDADCRSPSTVRY